MKVTIPISFKNGDNSFQRTIQFVNPNASDADLAAFINNLNALTDNTLTGALRVVEDFLNRSDSDIQKNDILAILNGTYSAVSVPGGISESDIATIMNGDYTTQPVSGGITKNDVDNIF